jgi:hypothetical protein
MEPKDIQPTWDYKLLLERLRKYRSATDPVDIEADADLRREAAAAIGALMAANTALHRRVQQVESPHLSELGKVRGKLEHYRGSSQHYSARFGHACQEIKRMYCELRRARPDGTGDCGYHSVMDMRSDGGETPPGTIWANKFKTKSGGIVSVRPAEIVAPLIDELIVFRKFFGSPPRSPSDAG